MKGFESFSLSLLDYMVFLSYFAIILFIGLWAGRKKKTDSSGYFLAGRTLPWYVVGSSFIAANISSEHFIGMIGASFVYGLCMAQYCWGNIFSFSLLVWFFIPFLLSARIFTTPEFLEKRFNPALRQFFAIVTIISNVIAFLAAVLYGGGIALEKLFGWDLWIGIAAIGFLAGIITLWGGLMSVAWADVFTVLVMFAGGILVTVLGLYMLSGDSHSLLEGWKIMVERNQAHTGVWAEAVAQNAQNILHRDTYNRMSVIQPITHDITPWLGLLLGVFSISIWYNVINQFMIQRVLGAKNMYHARMGIVLAGYMQILLPIIIVIPGLILFAQYPEVLKKPWAEIRPEADKGYVHMLQTVIPLGLRGLFLAALFGAIQSTIQSVLNSTATIATLDIYKRMIKPDASEKHTVAVGRWTTGIVLLIAMVLAGYIQKFGGGLFVYIQTLYAFFAPPFAAVFLLGILFRRINGPGASTAVFSGFAFGILMKVYVQFVPDHPAWLEPYLMQAIINWAFCVIVCAVVSLSTAPPRPEQITDQLTFNWKKMNIFTELGRKWYSHVLLWWGLFAAVIIILMVVFSGLFFKA
ncbi:MAG: Sodium/glucose cotransporter [Planctomycetes bacterium ADurb.Bin412]|nr:MAG: Sodium/glucose cotransporter [Planctomycetes bacterium ADurb.Bin412]